MTKTKNEIRALLCAHLDATLVSVADVNDLFGMPTGKVRVTLRSNRVVTKTKLIESAHAARRSLTDAGFVYTKGQISYTTHYGHKADDLYAFTVAKKD